MIFGMFLGVAVQVFGLVFGEWVLCSLFPVAHSGSVVTGRTLVESVFFFLNRSVGDIKEWKWARQKG